MQNHQLFPQAQRLHQQGQLIEAEQLYRQVVQVAPHYAEAKHMLGIVCSQQNRHAEGANWILQAIQKQPAHPPYYNNLGLVYAKMNNWQGAQQAFRAATRLAPQFAEAWFNLANATKSLHKIDEALRYYKKAVKLAPNHAKAMYNLGNTLLENGKPKSAREWFEKAIKIQPNYAEAHNNLGSALEAWNEYDKAVKHYEKAVELKPSFIDAVKNLGNAYTRHGNYQKGYALMEQYLKQKYNSAWDELILAGISPIIFEDTAAIEAYQQNLIATLQKYLQQNLQLDLSTLHERMLEPSANLPYQGKNTKTIKTLYGQLFNRYLPEIQRTKAIQNAKPHIGFVVTNGHEGVFMKCMAGILNNMDSKRFQITIVCSLPHGEQKLRPAIKNPQVKYLGIPKELDQSLNIIARTNFDILHYWEIGTDYQNYFLPFFRLAKVQCATWGWPTTSGIPQLDYFLSCELLESENANEHYSEQLIRFKKLPTYYYRPPVPAQLEPIESFGLPSGVPIYLCAQNLRKIHPDFDQLVKAILEKDEKGHIVFIQDSHSNVTRLLQERLQRNLVNLQDLTNLSKENLSKRIHFLERLSAERYLNLVAKADVILDTLYYTGGANTAYDAIAAGTPYVTLPSELHRSRFGAAAYQQIGVTDAIAENETDYVEKAVKIANDKAYRTELSQRILDHAHKVFEDREAVRELEAFFGRICQIL
ncbi:MAG: tetratricopeptide repeat protein [Bacteroidota bacterium]